MQVFAPVFVPRHAYGSAALASEGGSALEHDSAGYDVLPPGKKANSPSCTAHGTRPVTDYV